MLTWVASAAIWIGAATGLLTIIDWSLSEPAKKFIKSKAEDFWIWLDDQKAGRFIGLMRNTSVQYWFSIIAHLTIILLLALVFLTVFLD